MASIIESFGRPWCLLFLLLLPVVAWLKGRRGTPPAFVYSSVQLVRSWQQTSRSHAGAWLAALRWLALALLIVALAQPRLLKNTTEIKASGVDIVVAMDMSGSMISEDFEVQHERVNRFNMARQVLSGFIDKRPNDRIGLVLFATQAFIATPLTLDHDFLHENLDRLEIGDIDENATAIGDGLATAINRLRDLKAKSKIVILMTDGQNNSGKLDPLLAADIAKSLGVKVYTVGIGRQGTAPMPYTDVFGRRGYRNMPVDVDETTLQKVAAQTGGKYYRADNAEKFRQIYDEIDRFEKTEASVKKFTEYTELFPWFAGAGLVVLLLELALAHTIFRRLP
ncbi:MAG TPA: VWA domain-containing protein [Verrucomicrobiae bacterium]